MEMKKYGPKIRGNIYHNDYKKEPKHPDYSQRGKYQVQVTDEFLKHLVTALRTEGVEPRIGVSLWEKQGDSNTYFGVQLEAVTHTPEEGEEQQQPQRRREPEPPSEPPPPVDAYDDIPF